MTTRNRKREEEDESYTFSYECHFFRIFNSEVSCFLSHQFTVSAQLSVSKMKKKMNFYYCWHNVLTLQLADTTKHDQNSISI